MGLEQPENSPFAPFIRNSFPPTVPNSSAPRRLRTVQRSGKRSADPRRAVPISPSTGPSETCVSRTNWLWLQGLGGGDGHCSAVRGSAATWVSGRVFEVVGINPKKKKIKWRDSAFAEMLTRDANVPAKLRAGCCRGRGGGGDLRLARRSGLVVARPWSRRI